jgi:hypothetical protein
MPKELTTKTTSTELMDFKYFNPASAKHAQQVLRENLGPQGLQPQDLTRIKIPTAGNLTWRVDTIEGPTAQESIAGIIIHFADRRAYWKEKYSGSNEPPQCASHDMQRGIGDPGGDCQTCPFNQFGSGTDAKGKPDNSKACKEGRLLFLLRPDDIIPVVLSLSVMSIKPSRAYFQALAGQGIPYYGVMTEIGLTEAKSSGGITYSKATFKAVRRLTEAQIDNIKATTAEMMAALKPHAMTIEPEEVYGEQP